MNDITENQTEDAAEQAAPKNRRPGRPALSRAPRTTGRPNTRVQARPEPEHEEQSASREEPRGPRLQRRQRSEDPLFIDPRTIPNGVSYEWKRVSSYGQPDPHHQTNLRENHWLPVPANRHPELVPTTGPSNGTIAYNGLILMERPNYLTKEARQEDFQAAIDQVRSVGAQVAATPDNTMTRDHPSVKANSYIKRSYEPVRQTD